MVLAASKLTAQGVLSSNPHWVRTQYPFDPETVCAHDGRLFAGGEGGLSISDDNGQTWQLAVKDLRGDTNPPEVQMLYSFGDYVFAKVVDWGVWRSTNNGDDWTRPLVPISPFNFSSLDNYLFCVVGTVSRSADSANTWVVADSNITPRTSGSHHPACVSVVAVGHSLFASNTDGEIFRSIDYGNFWTKTHDAIGKYLYAINDTTFFASTGANIYRSTDNGINWTNIKSGFDPYSIIVNHNQIFMGGYYGIILSTDNGDTWKSINGGTLDTMNVVALAINNGYVFAGGYFPQSMGVAGLWRCPLSDLVDAVVENNPSRKTPVVTVVGENIQFLNVDNSIDKITFYKTTGQAVKEVKNVESLSVTDFSSGFYEVVFSSRGLAECTSKLMIVK